MRTRHVDPVASQASRLKKDQPELYDYLVQRDRQIQRALSSIPDPEDTELSSVFRPSVLQQMLCDVSPGVGELATIEVLDG